MRHWTKARINFFKSQPPHPHQEAIAAAVIITGMLTRAAERWSLMTERSSPAWVSAFVDRSHLGVSTLMHDVFQKKLLRSTDNASKMSRGGYVHTSGNYPAPPLAQEQNPDRFYRPRPVTSDWDLTPNFPAPYEAAVHQQQVRSPGAPPAYVADAIHPHHARPAAQQMHFLPANASNPPHRGHDTGAYFYHPGQPYFQESHARPASAQHQRAQPSFGSVPPRTPSMYVNTAGQIFEDRPSQVHDARHFTSTQQSGIGPSLHQHDRQHQQPQHAIAPSHSQTEMPNPYLQHHFQNATDDVVDVEGAQRYRRQPYMFQDHARPSSSPPHALHPGQMYPHPHRYAAAAETVDEPVTCGVGIVFHSSDHGCLAVKRLVPGGPAARCGLIKQGDVLTNIDDTNVYQQSTSEINHLISGPQGSFVRLRFKRSGSNPVVAVVERVWAPSTAERSKALSNGGGPPSKVHLVSFGNIFFVRGLFFVIFFAILRFRRCCGLATAAIPEIWVG